MQDPSSFVATHSKVWNLLFHWPGPSQISVHYDIVCPGAKHPDIETYLIIVDSDVLASDWSSDHVMSAPRAPNIYRTSHRFDGITIYPVPRIYWIKTHNYRRPSRASLVAWSLEGEGVSLGLWLESPGPRDEYLAINVEEQYSLLNSQSICGWLYLIKSSKTEQVEEERSVQL